MKRFLLLFFFIAPVFGADYNQPPFEVKDPAVSENLREIYYQADKLSLLTSLFTYTFDSATNEFCIDDPTFCVDATNDIVVAPQINVSTLTSDTHMYIETPGKRLYMESDNELLTNPGFFTLQFGVASTIFGSTFGYMDAGNQVMETVLANNYTVDEFVVPRYIINGPAMAYAQSTGGDHNFYAQETGVAGSTMPTVSGEINLRLSIRNNGLIEIQKASNQIQLGPQGWPTTTINASTPSASRVYSIPDAGNNANFVMSNGAQATSGPFTMSGQPAFISYVGTTITNVTGDGTTYTVIFDQEFIDKNNDYNPATGIFTAPLTGVYSFTTNILFEGFDSTQFEVRLVTTPKTYQTYEAEITIGSLTDKSYGLSAIAYMTAGDTARINVRASNGTKVTDIFGASTLYSYFSGTLLN